MNLRPNYAFTRNYLIFDIAIFTLKGNSLQIDPVQCPPLSSTAFRPTGVYNDNFQVILDRVTAC